MVMFLLQKNVPSVNSRIHATKEKTLVDVTFDRKYISTENKARF